MQRNRHTMFGVIGLFVCLGAVFSARSARADYTARIDPALQYQTFEGWGTSLCWFANVIGGAPDDVRNRYADMLFDPDKGLGLNVVRYNIGGGENPDYHSLQPRAAVPGYASPAGAYDWSRDANQRWFLNAALARGADQLEAFSNSPPYWMTVSGSVSGAKNGAFDNLAPQQITAFAQYLATVTEHFQREWHITFRDVEPCNEPGAWWWKFGGDQEGCHFAHTTQNAIVKSLGAALNARSLLCTVSASDENSIDEAVVSFVALDNQARAALTKVNTHSYNGNRRIGLWDLAGSAGKSLWMSEYGDGDATGLTMSEQILADMKRMHPTAWVYWQAVEDNRAPGWGMMALNLNRLNGYDFKVNEKYYVMANYSKFIRPGYKLIFCDDDQSLAAYNPAAQTLVIVTTNNTATDARVTYDLSAFGGIKRPVALYRTSATENLTPLNPVPASRERGFALTAKAMSVTTCVLYGVSYRPRLSATMSADTIGSGVNHFTFTGRWAPGNAPTDASRPRVQVSAHPGDTGMLRFVGAQALLYGAVGPTYGIMAVSIDGGPEEEVDLYARKPLRGGLIYSGPSLPQGAHTLRVRVTGRKHPAATACAIELERAESVEGRQAFAADGVYELVNRNSGNVMDVNQQATTPGARLVQWPANGGSNQRWRITPLAGGAYRLTNVHSGLTLDGEEGEVTQEVDKEGASRQWRITPIQGLYYRIVNCKSGLSLAVAGGSSTDGAGLIVQQNNGALDQQWAVLRIR